MDVSCLYGEQERKKRRPIIACSTIVNIIAERAAERDPILV